MIAGQYSAPQPVDALPPRARPVYVEYGDVTLIAYERSDRRYSAGDAVAFTLYWQARDKSAADHSILLRLVDDNQQTIGSYLTYPGAGSLRTSAWQPGSIYPDKYLVPISQAAYGRYPFDLHVMWRANNGASKLEARDESGRSIAPVLLDIGAVVSVRQQTAARVFNEIPVDSQPVFDEVIRLEGFQLDIERNEIGLHWKADSAPEVNYTVFAHLLDDNENILTQADAPPRLPTRYWRWGETFVTYHQFPPAPPILAHRVVVGLYLADEEGYPKAEFVDTAEADPEFAVEDEAPPAEADIDESAAEDLEPEETLLDAYAINWEEAAEVIALTPTPEPTPEPDDGEPEG